MRDFLAYLGGAALVLAAGSAWAVPLNGGVGSASGLSGYDDFLGFEDDVGAETDDEITTQFAGFGVTFAPHVHFNPDDFGQNFKNIEGNYVGNYSFPGTLSEPIFISFSELVSAASFALAVATNSTAFFSARLNGEEVESFQVLTTFANENNFYGFENIVFDEIQLYVNSSSVDIFQLDSIAFTFAVPVPTPLVLMLSALGGLALLGRRRRAARGPGAA